jgi:peptide/nickel transport system ATP-binding protein
MYAGSIVEEADVATLFSNPQHPYTRALIEAVPRLTGAGLPKAIEGVVPDYIEPPAGCRFHPRCDFARPECEKKPAVVDLGGGHRVACVLAEGVRPKELIDG